MYIYTVQLYVFCCMYQPVQIYSETSQNTQMTNTFADLHVGLFYYRTSTLGMFIQLVNLNQLKFLMDVFMIL